MTRRLSSNDDAIISIYISDGFTTHRRYLLRSNSRSRWSNEHERSALSLSHQHDLSECVRCYQCKLTNSQTSAVTMTWRFQVFSAELPIFIRESRARLYRTSTYFLGKTLAELPLFLAVPILFTTIAYPMVGLREGFYYFAIACGVVSLVANVSTSFGYLISCASSSISMALSVGPPVIIPFLIFGGFFLNSGSVPYYFVWLSYLSWFRYGNEALLINQWTGVTDIICTRSNATCPSSGKVILETLNFSPVSWLDWPTMRSLMQSVAVTTTFLVSG